MEAAQLNILTVRPFFISRGLQMEENVEQTTEQLEKMEHKPDGMKMDMPPNYVLDFEALDALEEMEEERQRLMKRGKQFIGMLETAQAMTDIEKIRDGMGRMMRKAGYMKPVPMVEEKAAPMKTEGGVSYPKADFAYTPSDEVSTWKLRLAEGRPGNITRSQLGAAAAALSPGGFRGNRVELPSDAVAGVKRRIRAEYEKLGINENDIPESVRKELSKKNQEAIRLLEEWQNQDPVELLKSRGSFELYKEGDNLRWLAVYSNKFRDNDNPPEIISEASHKGFVDMVDKGQAEYPELWYWHIPGTRFGIADYVAYDDSGFAIASGTIDPGKEHIAKNIAEKGSQLVSHGMPISSIERDGKDPSIITSHKTVEISVLPANMAANKLTNFLVNSREDKGMSLPNDKAQTLQELGFDVEAIQQGLEAKAQTAVNEGIEFKETETVVTEVEDQQETAQPEGDYVSRQELFNLIENMGGVIKELKAEIVGLKEAQQAGIEKQLERTPAASLTAMWQSAIGSEEARLDGRTSLAKAGPEEVKQTETIPGLPQGISQLVMQSRQGWQ